MSSASHAAGEMNGKSEAGSSGSSSGSNGTSLPGLAAGETCAYMSPNRNTGCRMPRPCDSCLATSGCLIDATGTCASVRDVRLNPTMDYRLAISQGLVLPKPTASAAAVSQQQMWQFPAGQVAYCDASDAVCRSCRMANFWRSRGTYPDSRYCLGDGGCVCIDVCERRWFVQPDCPLAGSGGSGLGGDSQDGLLDQGFVNNVWQAMVGAMLFVVLVFALMFRSRRRAETTRRREQDEERRRQEEARRQQRQQERASELGVNMLTLAGWETHRRDLLDKASAQSTTTPADETVATTVQEETAVVVDHETAYVRMSEEGEGRRSGAPGGDGGGAAAAGGDAVAAERPSNTSSVSPTGGPAPALAPLSTTRTLRPTGVRTRRG